MDNNTSDERAKLEPCPFCGSRDLSPATQGKRYVSCNTCGCFGPGPDRENSGAMTQWAIVEAGINDAWNRPPTPSPIAPPFDVEAMLTACVPGGYSCDPQRVADEIRAYCEREGVKQSLTTAAPAVGAPVAMIEQVAQPLYDLAWKHGARQHISFAGDELESLSFTPSEFEAFCAELAPPAASTEGVTDLHPRTADLVDRFASALKAKLATAEKKYGYSDKWSDDDWRHECVAKLLEHVAKGDPRDVAAYCAFMWHHGWSTAAPAASLREQEDAAKVICPACCHQFRAIPQDVQSLMLAAGFEPPFTEGPSLADWVVERWHAEVANRPLENKNRRPLDDAWRQMLRHLGVDPVARLGPAHDELLVDAQRLGREKGEAA